MSAYRENDPPPAEPAPPPGPPTFEVLPHGSWGHTRCPKCAHPTGGKRIGSICTGPRKTCFGRGAPCPHVQHFHVRCESCGSRWLEAPADGKAGRFA